MSDDIIYPANPSAGWRCPKCEVYTSRSKEEHICLATKCAMCGWRWRAPLGVNLRYTSWGKCACSDVNTCLRHQVCDDELPTRPPQAELEARAQANYDADLKRWEFKRDQLNKRGQRWAALEELWQSLMVHIDKLPNDPRVDRAVAALRNHAMWAITPEQFEFLKTRFKDPYLWLEDCERWIGHPLVGNKVHWCYDWDGLPVDETTKEFECCSCWPEETINGIQKEDHQNEAPQAPTSEEDDNGSAGAGKV